MALSLTMYITWCTNGRLLHTVNTFTHFGHTLTHKMSFGQRHAKKDLRTYAKSVHPDQPPCLRRRVWSGSALFDTRNIDDTYFSCYVNNLNIYSCFQHRIGADLSLHYVKSPKVPFRVTLAILYFPRLGLI